MGHSLIWHPERRLLSTLKTWSKNPRKISAKKFAQLVERIKQRGNHDVVKIDVDDTILSGNQRKKAFQKLGIKEVTVLVPNRKLTEEERDKIGLESNISDGDWDFEGIKKFDLDTLDDVHFDTNLLWTENLQTEDDRFDVDKEIKKITKPKTKLGDILLLGPHKLICGNANDPDVLKKLFGKDKASMIYSDPIYNIGIDYNGGIGGKANYGGNVNDNRTNEEYKEFLRKSLINALAVAKDDCHVFYWSDQTYIGYIQDLYRELGIENKRVCLWLKNSQNPTPGVGNRRRKTRFTRLSTRKNYLNSEGCFTWIGPVQT